MVKHKHRINPGYKGGNYSEGNVVKVSVTQHAMWHFANWQLWGNQEDLLAWKGLSGQIGEEEIIRERCALSGRRYGKRNAARLNSDPRLEETRRKNGKMNVRDLLDHPNAVENRSTQGRRSKNRDTTKMAAHPNTKSVLGPNGRKTGSQRWVCLETGKVSNPGGLSTYQRKRGIDTSLRSKVESLEGPLFIVGPNYG